MAAHRVIPPRSPKRTRNRALALLGMLMTIAFVILCWRPLAASAANAGPGYSPDGSAGAFVGAMDFNGTNVYCLELDHPSPIGHPTRVATAGDALPADIAQMDAGTRARLHWVVTTRGSSSEPTMTAAVAMYVWSVADAEHYRGDAHYLSLVPATKRERVAANLREIRRAASDVRIATIPQTFALSMRTQPGSIVLEIGDIPEGTEAVLRVTDGTINGERELTVPAGKKRSLRVRPMSHTKTLTVSGHLKAAPGAATAQPQYLITDGHQLLIGERTQSWPSKRVSVELIPGIRNVPSTTPATKKTPTPTPKPTPTPTPVSSPTPTPTPVSTPTPTPKPTPTPTPTPKQTPSPTPTRIQTTPASTPTPSQPETPPPPATPEQSPADPVPSEPAATPESTPTPEPTPSATPTATFSTSQAEPTVSDTPREPPAQPEQPHPDEPAGQLAETGADGSVLLMIGGGAITAIGAGGWLLARKRDTGEEEAEYVPATNHTSGW